MNHQVVNELNTVLKGEQMAVEAYDHYIQKLKDEDVKRQFQEIQQDHKKNSMRLAEHIQTIGGNPQYSTGIAGMMANVKFALESNDTTDIIKHAYNGEDQGIGMAEEIIKGDLDSQSRSLVKDILSIDHDHLKRMSVLIEAAEKKKS